MTINPMQTINLITIPFNIHMMKASGLAFLLNNRTKLVIVRIPININIEY